MLVIKNFSKSYQKNKKACDDISLTIEDGDLFGFIGPNGAGKSTTIKSIVGILDFEQGDILLDNLSIKEHPEECKKKMAYIPDNPDLYSHLKAIKYLNFICDVFEVPKDVRKERILFYAKKFEIEDKLNEPIHSYSHGMRQKLAFIGAFIHEPKLMILDEPFVGLDPKSSFTLKETMKEYVAKGNSIFFSSHVLEVVEKLCNKVAIINNGKIICCGPLDVIRGDESLEDMFLEITDNE